MLGYQRSLRNSRFQRLLTVYWKSAGVASKAIDVLHASGLSMSQKWMRTTFVKMERSTITFYDVRDH